MFARKKQPLIKSLIAQGTQVQGDVLFTDGLRIDGDVQGDVRSESGPSIVVVSETARIRGSLMAAHVIINGVVEGPVHASGLLELQPKARVNGDLHYKALEMHQGALVSGRMCPVGEMLLEGQEIPRLASPIDP